MNKTARAVFILLIITFTIFSPICNANSAMPISIQLTGSISQAKTQFLLRGVWIGSQTTAADVDAYVAAHPWGTGIMLTDVSSGILSIISYNGWNLSQTWLRSYGGISYVQLKAVIDEYHRLGWKVIYSAGNNPTQSGDAYIYDYLINQHPELIAMSGNGSNYAQVNNGTAGTFGLPNQVQVNFFAHYATPDSARNIVEGQSLSDLYVQRLSQMISDGSFEWDGWFGVDGWNGLTQQGMYWLWNTVYPGTNQYVGTSNVANWYYGDEQSFNEFGNSSYAYMLPTNNMSFPPAYFDNFDATTHGSLASNYILQSGTAEVTNNPVDAIGNQLSAYSPPNSLWINTGEVTYATTNLISNYTMQAEIMGDHYSLDSGGLILYGASSSTGYAVMMNPFAAGGIGLGIYKKGVQETNNATIGALSSNQWYSIKATIQTNSTCTTIYGKIWQIGAPEPNWQVTFVDTTNPITGGTFGLTSTSQRDDWFDNLNVTGIAGSSVIWDTMSVPQKVNWVIGNANLQWWQYWQMRFAQFYGQINQVFVQRGSNNIGTIISQDMSSGWAAGGINCPVGMENLTMFQQYNSFNLYYIDCEWNDYPNYGREQAYVAGLVASKIPTADSVAGFGIDSNGNSVPPWVWKQQYLAMIQTYVWRNGNMYRAVNPNIVIVWVQLNTIWSDSAENGQEMAYWVTSVANTLNSATTPVWLGQNYPLPAAGFEGSIKGINYGANWTYAQFSDALNMNFVENQYSSVPTPISNSTDIDYKVFTLSNGATAIPMMNIYPNQAIGLANNSPLTVTVNITNLKLPTATSATWLINRSTYPITNNQTTVTLYDGADVLIISPT